MASWPDESEGQRAQRELLMNVAFDRRERPTCGADENCTCPRGQVGQWEEKLCFKCDLISTVILLALRVHHRAGGCLVHCVLWGVLGLDAVA